MIIDAHTHYTTPPPQLQAYRGSQIANMGRPSRARLQISDVDLERSLQGHFRRDGGVGH